MSEDQKKKIWKKGFKSAKKESFEQFANKLAERIIEIMQDPLNWEKPWNHGQYIPGTSSWPHCALTGHEYLGVNYVMLLLVMEEKGYTDTRWLTYKQTQQYAKEHGIEGMHVKKGEEGTLLVRPEPYWYYIEKDENGEEVLNDKGQPKRIIVSNEEKDKIIEENDGKKSSWLKKGYAYKDFYVFNAEQITNFPPPEKPKILFNHENERDAFIEDLVACSGIPVYYETDIEYPHYKPIRDEIVMFPIEMFNSSSEFAETKLHEFFHATGYEKRENRLKLSFTKGDDYAFEELRAALFSFFTSSWLQIPVSEKNAAAYVQSWNRGINNEDKAKLVFDATKDAMKILNVVREFKEGQEISLEWFPKPEEWERLRIEQKERDQESDQKYKAMKQ